MSFDVEEYGGDHTRKQSVSGDLQEVDQEEEGCQRKKESGESSYLLLMSLTGTTFLFCCVGRL